jgi:hypothetical protein
LNGTDWTSASLWFAVVASGLYHGLNPGMGWPLAASAGLLERSARALLLALVYLTLGHLLAMLTATLPFALLSALVVWRRSIQIFASLLVLGFGLYLLIQRRHPRALSRIPPTQLVLWSFAIAMAHGAGLMLVPIYLGLSSTHHMAGHHPGEIMNANLSLAVLVSVVHTLAMISAGGALAWSVYRYLGPKFVSQSWFNLDALWAASLIFVGTIAFAFSIAVVD